MRTVSVRPSTIVRSIVVSIVPSIARSASECVDIRRRVVLVAIAGEQRRVVAGAVEPHRHESIVLVAVGVPEDARGVVLVALELAALVVVVRPVQRELTVVVAVHAHRAPGLVEVVAVHGRHQSAGRGIVPIHVGLRLVLLLGPSGRHHALLRRDPDRASDRVPVPTGSGSGSGSVASVHLHRFAACRGEHRPARRCKAARQTSTSTYVHLRMRPVRATYMPNTNRSSFSRV